MHYYKLPIISGGLVALIFYPFYIWPLAFGALVPLFYFAASSGRSKKQLFWGGCITGLIGIMPLIFFSLFQLRIIEGNELFSYLVHISSVPILLGIASLFGLMSLGFGYLRLPAGQYNAWIGASLYILLEFTLFWFFGGYYLGSFGHAIVSFEPARWLAAIGGVPLVVGVTSWINCMIAEILVAHTTYKIKYIASLSIGVLLIIGGLYGYQLYLAQSVESPQALPVSIIQIPYASKDNLPYGTTEKGVFTNPIVEGVLRNASQGNDLVVYPYTPLKGMTYKGGNTPVSADSLTYASDMAIGQWLQKTVPTTTTVLLWNTVSDNNVLYDEYAVWKNGEESEYRKRHLYPLSDYAPWWAELLHLHAFLFSIQPGPKDGKLTLNGRQVSGLICSELHQVGLARTEAVRSPLIIAVGSDTMFPGDLMGNFSLAAARYRAAENNIPVIRGNINGPSAIISASGSIQSSLGYAKEGTLQGTVSLQDRHKRTLSSIWGTLPVHVGAVILLSGALYRRRTRKI